MTMWYLIELTVSGTDTTQQADVTRVSDFGDANIKIIKRASELQDVGWDVCFVHGGFSCTWYGVTPCDLISKVLMFGTDFLLEAFGIKEGSQMSTFSVQQRIDVIQKILNMKKEVTEHDPMATSETTEGEDPNNQTTNE